jgi:Xaa-Pro aminopeptidase
LYEWPTVDWDALRTDRTVRLRELMARHQLDHLLLMAFDNIRFATDYRVMTIVENYDWFTALFDSSGRSQVFVPFVDERVSHPVAELPDLIAWLPTPSWSSATMHVEIYVRLLSDELRRLGARRVGYDIIPHQVIAGLESLHPEITFEPVAVELFVQRAEKHPIEVELLDASARVAAIAAEEALRSVQPGMRDYDVMAVAMESMQRQGAEYLTHSVCNVRLPQGEWFPRGQILENGDAFFFDIGCHGRGGYASDICRMAFVGDPRDEIVRAWEILLEAYRAGQELARPGTRVSEIHEATNDVLRKNELPHTPYAVGHGIGLRACEWPTINRREMITADPALVVGAAIALEPETFVEIAGRPVVLKVEDNFVVEAGGLRALSTATHAPDVQ